MLAYQVLMVARAPLANQVCLDVKVILALAGLVPREILVTLVAQAPLASLETKVVRVSPAEHLLLLRGRRVNPAWMVCLDNLE